MRHLAALEAVAAEGSFRRAAVRLGYVQSAVSHQIAALEQTIGQRLVERSRGGGGASLTTVGELVLVHGRAILARLQAAEADLAAADEPRAAELRVGLSQSVAARVLPRLMRRFGDEWPELQLRPRESSDDLELYDAIETGSLDLAFAELPAPAGAFEVFELLTDPYLLVVRRDAPLAREPSVAPHELGSLPLIGTCASRGLRRVEEELRALGVALRVVFRSNVDATAVALVAAGVGAAILPALAVDPGAEDVVGVPLAEIPPRVVALVRHRDRTFTEGMRSFVDAAYAACG